MIRKLMQWRGDAEMKCAYYQYDDRSHDLRWHLLKAKFDLTNNILKIMEVQS